MPYPRAGAIAPLLLVAASAFWGIATVLNKALLATLSPQLLLVLQLLPSAALLWTCTLLMRPRLPRGRLLWLSLALGALNPGVSYSLGLLGLDRVPASVAALLWSTEPLMILCLATIILAEPITLPKLFIIAAGFVGAGLATGSIQSGQLATDLAGVLFLLAAVFLCAIYTVCSRKIGVEVDALPLLAVQQGAGLLWSIFALFATGSNALARELSQIALSDMLAAVATGLIYYALAYWLYLSALRHVSASLAGSTFNVIPLVAVSVAFFFLGERLTVLQLGGAGLILLSVWLLLRYEADGTKPI